MIEVTLAIAITSVALIALLAMVPQGLMTMKLATDRAIEARIHQQIHAELALASWPDRFDFDDTIRYYDDQGIEVDRGNTSGDQDLVYAARIFVPQAGSVLPERLAQGGGGGYRPIDLSGDVNDENEVQLVLVEISTSPNVRDSADFDRRENWININTYTSTITRFIDFQSL